MAIEVAPAEAVATWVKFILSVDCSTLYFVAVFGGGVQSVQVRLMDEPDRAEADKTGALGTAEGGSIRP